MNSLLPNSRSVARSEQETWDIAARLTRELCRREQPTQVLALTGDLGAGKTTFVQGMAAEIGLNVPVTSPTFTLVNEYTGDIPLVHIDLYRLSSPDETIALGMEEYFDTPGIVAIEWPDRADGLLPRHTVRIHLAMVDQEDSRTITISTGERT